MTSIDTERYDRQLRLWGAHGQANLSSASVVCFGSSAAACEVLKNIILPGVGSVVICDDVTVTTRDLSINYFLDAAHVGMNRACAVVQHLSELNPTVNCVSASSIAALPVNLTPRVVVLTNPWVRNYMVKGMVDKAEYTVVVESVGFLGRVSLFASQPHVVLEPKSEEGRINDLFMTHPWPALSEYIDSFDFSLDAVEIELFHIPWLVVLAKACQLTAIRDRKSLLIAITNLENGRTGGLNFEEARQNVFHITALADDDETLSDITRIIADHCEAPCRTVRDLVTVLRAVLNFHDESKSLPLAGAAIPDMASTTDAYTRLVNLFKAKFDADVDSVTDRCKVDRNFVEKVFTNIRNLHVIDLPRMYENMNDSVSSPESKRHNFEDECMDESVFDEPEHEEIIRLLDGEAVDDSSLMKREFQRYAGGVELHSVSAMVGSVAAQEIVKLVTNQFTPIDNHFVFNGVKGSAFTY